MKTNWIASWTAAPMNVWGPDAPLSGFYGQTVREIARLTVGGSAVSVRLTNEFGTTPVRIEAAELALAGMQCRVDALTRRPLTFGGHRAATIAPGAPLVSDPVAIGVPPLARLAVSYYSSGFIPVETHHFEAQQTAFISEPGNFTEAEQMVVQQTTTSHYLLSAIYTAAAPTARGIVCLGDSITDGYASSIDADRRWPDVLAERLQRNGDFGEVAVLNQGIGGNRLLHSRRGQKALERFDRDVLSFAGISHLILLEGVNDIVWPNTVLAGPDEAVSADDLIVGIHQLLVRARLAGIKVLLGTLTPFEGTLPEFPHGGYYTPAKERIRQAINAWVRKDSDADGVLDFDAVLRDPAVPTRLLAEFDSGDHIHPNDNGYRAMANAIDTALLR